MKGLDEWLDWSFLTTFYFLLNYLVGTDVIFKHFILPSLRLLSN